MGDESLTCWTHGLVRLCHSLQPFTQEDCRFQVIEQVLIVPPTKHSTTYVHDAELDQEVERMS